MSFAKTNAMRTLDKAKIEYEVFQYDSSDGLIDGVSVAKKIGQDPKNVYKTLVTVSATKNYYVFLIPVEMELDLKLGAKAVGEKKIEMIKVSDIEKITGYIRGGCSVLNMKKQFKTCFDISAKDKIKIVLSPGKIGLQMQVNPIEVANVINAQFINLVK